MSEGISSQRARRAEADYFHRRELESLASIRAAHQVRADREALAAALGAHDDEAVARLYTWGMRAASASLLEWLPAIEVAWLDGADDGERQLLRQRFGASPSWSAEAGRLLDEWLERRPSHGLFAAARRALRARLHGQPPDLRQAAIDRIVSTCIEAGQAAGGFFGFGALSGDERRHIEFIRQDLARPL